MNNELIELKSWWKRNWKGCVPVSVVVLFSVGILFSSGMSGVAVKEKL
jgi:predicted negative regulator of RcsB-dependent stress response